MLPAPPPHPPRPTAPPPRLAASLTRCPALLGLRLPYPPPRPPRPTPPRPTTLSRSILLPAAHHPPGAAAPCARAEEQQCIRLAEEQHRRQPVPAKSSSPSAAKDPPPWPTSIRADLSPSKNSGPVHLEQKEQMQEMQRQVSEMQQIVFSKGSHNVETPTPSPPNSISRPVYSRIAPDDDDEEEEHEGHHDAVQEDEGLFIQKRIPSSHNVASTHVPPRSHAATPSVCQASHNQEESLVGRDVILYHLVSSDPVAKAMVISTNQDTIVGGEVLGMQYYEVLVNVVLKREVELARGYDGMKTMGDAHHMSIAWPSNRIKPCSRSRVLSSQSSGTNGRK